MTDKTGEDKYAKYASFDGPDEDARTQALRDMRRKQGHGGGTVEQGGEFSNRSHRDWKHRPGWIK